MRQNLDNKKHILEKKKDKEANINIKILFNHLNGNNVSNSPDAHKTSNDYIKLPLKVTKSDKTFRHLYKINEILLKDTNRSCVKNKENVEKFSLRNTLKGEFLPHLPLMKNCSLNNTYIHSSIRNYKKKSKYKKAD